MELTSRLLVIFPGVGKAALRCILAFAVVTEKSKAFLFPDLDL